MEILLKHLFVAATFSLSTFLFLKPEKAVEFAAERTDIYKFVPKESFTYLYRVVGLVLMIVIVMMIVKHQI